MPRCESLDEVRANIDRIDREIVRLLGERGGFVDEAARFKSTEATVRAPERVAAMVGARRGWAVDEGLDPDLVDQLFRTLTDYFIGQELRRWQQPQADEPNHG